MAMAGGRPLRQGCVNSRPRAGLRTQAALELCCSLALVCMALLQPLLAAGQPGGAANLLLETTGGNSMLPPNVSSCELTVQYTVYMGDQQLAGPGNASASQQAVPNFQAFLSVISPKVITDMWALGWRFPANATIQSTDAVQQQNSLLPVPDRTLAAGPTYLQLANPGSTSPILLGNGTFTGLSFIGTKTPEQALLDPAYSVVPIDEVVFQNLACPEVEVPKPNLTQDTLAVYNSTKLQVQYVPIEFVDQPQVSTFSAFLIRVTNVQNLSSIELSSLSFRYWMSSDLIVPLLARAPWISYQASCIISSAPFADGGCRGINVFPISGYPDIPGADIVVGSSFDPQTNVTLRPSGAGAIAPIFDQNQNPLYALDKLDIYINVSSVSGKPLLKPHKDYSYMLPPLTNETGASPHNLVRLYKFVENQHIAAYISGSLVWGILPPAGQKTSNGTAPSVSSLPPGVSCDIIKGGTVRSCFLSATYCCSGPAPVPPYIPADWPPDEAGVSWKSVAEQLELAGQIPEGLAPAPVVEEATGEVPAAEAPTAGASGSGGPAVNPVPPGPPPPPSSSSSGGSNVGLIAGVAVGGVGLVAAALSGFLLLRKRRQKQERSKRGLSHGMSHGMDDLGGMEAGGAAVLLPHSGGQIPGVAIVNGKGLQRRSVAWEQDGGQLLADPGSSSSDRDCENGGGGLSNLTEAQLALLERKASTAPTLAPLPTRPGPRTEPARGRSSISSSRSRSRSSSSSGSSLDGLQPNTPPAATLLKHSKSWDGVLQLSATWDSAPDVFRRQGKRERALGGIPPVTPLPPPVSPHAGPLPDVDLNVDYETEVAPFLGRCLGTGGFGSVYEGTYRGRRVAVKKLPQMGLNQTPGSSQQLYDALIREIQLMSKFNSDRLVRVYGACTRDPTNVCLIMELMDGGNLFQRIYDRKKRRLSYLDILQLAHDMAAGLAYLHPSVVHRDLKPQNVLVDGEGRAKLADFGISRVKDPTKSYLSSGVTETGTPMYMAPEQFNGSKVDEKVDVFALGVILNECYTRRPPWKDSSIFFHIILKVAINGERPWMDPDCPDPLRKLVTKCWHQNPHMRPSPSDIMRLTEFLIQEELRKWELPHQHQNQQPQGQLLPGQAGTGAGAGAGTAIGAQRGRLWGGVLLGSTSPGPKPGAPHSGGQVNGGGGSVSTAQQSAVGAAAVVGVAQAAVAATVRGGRGLLARMVSGIQQQQQQQGEVQQLGQRLERGHHQQPQQQQQQQRGQQGENLQSHQQQQQGQNDEEKQQQEQKGKEEQQQEGDVNQQGQEQKKQQSQLGVGH